MSQASCFENVTFYYYIIFLLFWFQHGDASVVQQCSTTGPSVNARGLVSRQRTANRLHVSMATLMRITIIVNERRRRGRVVLNLKSIGYVALGAWGKELGGGRFWLERILRHVIRVRVLSVAQVLTPLP